MNFPSINQFRHVVRDVRRQTWFEGIDENDYPVYNKEKLLPTLNITGTVKLHGTNAAVEMSTSGDFITRSRRRIITPSDDNCGFSKFANERVSSFKELQMMIGGDCIIYGEWAGKGIMKGCGIHETDRAFYIFSIRKGDKWLDMSEYGHIEWPSQGIYNIIQFSTFKMSIDFNAPAEAAEELARLTEEVEKQCPVAAYFGAKGIGEGIVWTFDDPEYNSSNFWFKVKGDKHKVASTKQKVEVDVEKLKSVSEFVETVLTEARLNQGLTQVPELDKRYTGQFLKWVVKDVLKEESDRLETSGIEEKDVTKALSGKARAWFFKQMEVI